MCASPEGLQLGVVILHSPAVTGSNRCDQKPQKLGAAKDGT
jgi:hypothetical protein